MINATPGSVSANSYVTTSEADSYFDTRLYSSVWSTALSGDQESAIISSTRQLDEEYIWSGLPTNSDQALGWPRTGAYNCENISISATVIPPEIKNATYEQAIYLLTSDTTVIPSVLTQGVKRGKLDVLEFEADVNLVADKLTDNIALCLAFGYLRNTNAGFIVRGF